jgi:hypothetical protein
MYGHDLEIGGADPGQADAHDGLVRPGCRRRMVIDAAKACAVEVERPHQAAR